MGRFFKLLAGVAGAGATQPLRFAASQNYVSNNAGVAAAGTRLHSLSRRLYTIGSGDFSELRIVIPSFNLSGGASIPLVANAFRVEGRSLEKLDASLTVPWTFSGAAAATVNPGDSLLISDPIFPSAFGLAVFARDSGWYVREDNSVTAAGLLLPQGTVNYNYAGFPNNVGITYDPAVFTGGTVNGTGQLNLAGGGWVSMPIPPQGILIGRCTSNPAVWVAIGDSIVAGAGDTQGAPGSSTAVGLFTRSLHNGGVSTIAGCNMGSSGSTGSIWQGAHAALAKELWPFADHAFDNFGTNRFITVQPATLEQAAATQNWADLRAAGITKILRTQLTPRCSSTDLFVTTANQAPLNASWQVGGGAWVFNDWLPTQVGPTGPTVILGLNTLRFGATPDTTDYYTWPVDGTANKYVDAAAPTGVHPSTFGHILAASTDVRPAMLAIG